MVWRFLVNFAVMKLILKVVLSFVQAVVIMSCASSRPAIDVDQRRVVDSTVVHYRESLHHTTFLDSLSFLFSKADTTINITRIIRQADEVRAHQRDTVCIFKYDTVHVKQRPASAPSRRDWFTIGCCVAVAVIVFAYGVSFFRGR